MDLSIVIVSYNTRQLLLDCLESIYGESVGIDMEVIVVDNMSTDGSVAALQCSFPQVRLVVNTKNVGLAPATNQGISIASGRYVLYLNSDTRVGPGTLEGLVRFADSRPDASAFTCRILNPDGTLQHSCFHFPGLRMALYGFFPVVPMDSLANGRYAPECYNRVFEPQHVLGACLMARRSIIEEVGGWDNGFFLYFEDTDFCYRIWQSGHYILYTPNFFVVHYGGQSSLQNTEQLSALFYRSQSYFYRKHYGLLKFVALKGIVFFGLLFWTARTLGGYLRRRIDKTLLRTRLDSYLRILFA